MLVRSLPGSFKRVSARIRPFIRKYPLFLGGASLSRGPLHRRQLRQDPSWYLTRRRKFPKEISQDTYASAKEVRHAKEAYPGGNLLRKRAWLLR